MANYPLYQGRWKKVEKVRERRREGDKKGREEEGNKGVKGKEYQGFAPEKRRRKTAGVNPFAAA